MLPIEMLRYDKELRMGMAAFLYLLHIFTAFQPANTIIGMAHSRHIFTHATRLYMLRQTS